MVKISKDISAQSAYYMVIDHKNDLTKKQMDIVKNAIKNSEYAIKFAIHTRRPFPEGEDRIAKNGVDSYKYAYLALRGRFEKGEEAIAKDALMSLEYAERVLKGNRFLAGEPAIAKYGLTAALYVEKILKRDFPEAEAAIARKSHTSLQYAEALGKAFPAGEKSIAECSHDSLRYAVNVMKCRISKFEPVIFSEPHTALPYALIFDIKDLPPTAVASIAKNSWSAYLYATCIIKGPFKIAEKVLAKGDRYDDKFIMYHRYLETGGTDPTEANHRAMTIRTYFDSKISIPKIQEIESVIAGSAIESYLYAGDTEKRFELGEPAMKKVPAIWRNYQKMLKDIDVGINTITRINNDDCEDD